MSTTPTTITAPDGVPFIEIVREFDAPVAAVFRAYVEPDLVTQWIGPNGYEMTITEWDLTTGGRYAYSHRDPAKPGEEYGFRGVVHEVVVDDHITQTFEYVGAPGQVSLETATFEDLGGGRSRVRGWSTFNSVEARDGMVAAGMERGVVEGYQRLDDLLAGTGADTGEA
jgi:uncharacterized protein YndB with AHSA1/START domain